MTKGMFVIDCGMGSRQVQTEEPITGTDRLGDSGWPEYRRARRLSGWFAPLYLVATIGVLPAPLYGQFGEESTFQFRFFTGCAPIRVTGEHFTRIRGEWTSLEVPADVKHVIQTQLAEQDLATEGLFAWGFRGDPQEATILPRMEVSAVTQPSGRRSIALSFQKWLQDPMSGKEHYATTWNAHFEDRPDRESELAAIETLVGMFLDDYLEANVEACEEK